MIPFAQQIIVESQNSSIHWEAVLVTAIPAMAGAIAAIAAAYMGTRNKTHLKSIDRAVNGTEPHEATLRENVEAINTAVNGAAPGEDSIRENVQTLTRRRDLDSDVQALTDRRDLDPELEANG
jgi:hypothetical protein